MQVPISLSGPPLSFLAVQQAGTPSVLPGRVSPGERQHVSSVPVPCYYSHPAAGGSVTSSSLASSAPDHAPPASDRVVVSYPPLHILAGPGGGGRLSRPSGASLPCLSAAPYSSGGERRLSVGSAHSEGRDSSADAVYAPASPCSYRAHSSSAYASQARDSGPPPPLGERRGAGGPQSRRYDAGFADRSATLSPAKDPCANNMGSPPFGGSRPAYSRSGWPNPQPNSGGGRGPGGSRPQYHRAPRDVWMAGEEDRGGRTRRERYSEDEREEALEFIRPPAPTRPVGYPNKTVGGGGRGVRQRSPSYSPERRGPPPPKVSGGGRDFVTSAAAGHHSASGGRTPETVSRRLIVEDRYASKEPFYGTSSRYTEKPRETGESTRRAFAPENHARGSCHPCAFYAVGRCRNGVDCRNCHDEDHSDPHSPLFALDVLHKMGLCIVCIDFKKKGVCDDSDRVHGMLYCHHPHHCPTSQHGRVEESRGKDDLLHAGGSGVRRAVTDPPSKIRRRDDWGENYVSSSRSRQEEDCGDYMFRDSGRRRLLSCERYAPTYNPSSRSYSTVGGGVQSTSVPSYAQGAGIPTGEIEALRGEAIRGAGA
ncbi:hypothetical protein BESB_055150 [Besnoitia besnoiti]|uniref:C3H1-type domain-containing protein n=1 Tax=Besnoitia besnoiti TaxID=94643 RepID=A0A2A9MF87_BESBE|nr:hypothetical protein BESB_055150 [Besnoitia besnoiti]PFH35864.1 hypothetical protein BESB_055150 [Besnoitia besnoiti]